MTHIRKIQQRNKMIFTSEIKIQNQTPQKKIQKI